MLYATSRPIRACVDLAAIRNNHGIARRFAGTTKLWAVIKANAYGHGQIEVAQALQDVADGFALLEVENAIALRGIGIRQPLLLLEGFFAPEDIAVLAQLDVTPVLHSAWQLEMLTAAEQRPSAVYLKLNSGMNRLGFTPQMIGAAQAQLKTLGIRHITLMTHFANADLPHGLATQWPCCQALRRTTGLPVSFANSAALIRYPQTRGDETSWARPGIMLYGASPFADASAASFGLKPAMTLESRLIGIQTLATGEYLGYGSAFRTDRPMCIGTVACGYADGYPRHAPTGTPIAVGGHLTRTLGRVSMDMLACDLSQIPEAKEGTPVTLWGVGEGGTVDVDTVATAAGTISYELLCAVTARVPRSWR
ncbi:MAG: alanine racemase [Zoogloeaceae bacterium]|nr:alanine racemase [Zoogloeaceae bacterium]